MAVNRLDDLSDIAEHIRGFYRQRPHMRVFCANCFKRRGEHYGGLGGETESCIRLNSGQFFKPVIPAEFIPLDGSYPPDLYDDDDGW